MAIQLVIAAGYEVITTASPRNFDYIKGLGAGEVVDYHNATVVNDIVKKLEGRSLVGTVDVIGGKALRQCIEVVRQAQGKKVVITTNPSSQIESGDVRVQFVLALAIKDSEISKIIYGDFLPKALEKGKLVPAPEPFVIGKGLDKIQEAVDTQRAGVHAKKIVITL
jgi:NADPH:quinone reductase and related Zn-dependent oxidoreductases